MCLRQNHDLATHKIKGDTSNSSLNIYLIQVRLHFVHFFIHSSTQTLFRSSNPEILSARNLPGNLQVKLHFLISPKTFSKWFNSPSHLPFSSHLWQPSLLLKASPLTPLIQSKLSLRLCSCAHPTHHWPTGPWLLSLLLTLPRPLRQLPKQQAPHLSKQRQLLLL